MNFPYQILELELESLFYKRWDEKPRRAVLASVLDSMVPLALSAVSSHTSGCEVAHYWSFMLAYFTSRIRIDALHVDVKDLLPPIEAQIWYNLTT